MKKSISQLALSLILVLSFAFGMGTNLYSKATESNKKTELKTTKEPQKATISSFSELTFPALNFNVEAALIYIFAFDFTPKIIQKSFLDFTPQTLSSYWSKLFQCSIITNAP
jgi:hypothetical protein